MYKIHFAPIDLEGDIQEFDLLDQSSLLAKIYDLVYESLDYVISKHFVVLIAVEDEIFVSDTICPYDTVGSFAQMFTEYLKVEQGDCMDFFLQFYTSYEEAYKMALCMKETNKLCYE